MITDGLEPILKNHIFYFKPVDTTHSIFIKYTFGDKNMFDKIMECRTYEKEGQEDGVLENLWNPLNSLYS